MGIFFFENRISSTLLTSNQNYDESVQWKEEEERNEPSFKSQVRTLSRKVCLAA
jgi:hypothetical protein